VGSIGSTPIVAAGRVEAISEEIQVSSEISGQVLAEIENDDFRARVAGEMRS
jgi:hypothetical protein